MYGIQGLFINANNSNPVLSPLDATYTTKNTKRDRENKAVMTSLLKQLTVGR